jgi:DNA-binding transcriptional LysR family regulator
MVGELDVRLLRHFVAVAEELHFTRAAARLYVAQQALSRDIRRLEQQLGVRLLTRTTRRVALTPEGERLLLRARELLALHDQTVQELGGHDHPLLVDLLAEGHTPARLLRAARQRAPKTELVARFHGGFGAALELLLAGRLDVAFGRSEGLGRPFPTQQLARRLVRLEPLALLLPRSIRSPAWTRCRWRRCAAPRWTSAPATSTRRSGSTLGCACWRRSGPSRPRPTCTPPGWRRPCSTCATMDGPS